MKEIYYCDSLHEIAIPRSVSIIKGQAFGSNIELIKCEIESKPEGWADNWYIGSPTIVYRYVIPFEGD